VAAYFLDSSALVKRYVREKGSLWIDRFFGRAGENRIYIASVTGVEVIAAIARRSPSFRSPSSVEVISSEFLDDFGKMFRVLQIDEPVVFKAMELARKHRFRGYDALQLSVALEVHSSLLAVNDSVTLVAADAELNAAAIAQGLLVENPSLAD
jgi:uncharacterized protein